MDQLQKERNAGILEWFDALLFALTIVMFLLLFVVRTVNVDGTSMVPTLQDKDQLLARSFAYAPQRGDIVIIDGHTQFGKPLVKRVIGLGGDVVDIDFDTGEVFVNDALLEEGYISAPTTIPYDILFPVTVPEGHLFLLGDNRPYSKDSRHSDIGFIDDRDVLGQAFFRLLPASRFGFVE